MKWLSKLFRKIRDLFLKRPIIQIVVNDDLTALEDFNVVVKNGLTFTRMPRIHQEIKNYEILAQADRCIVAYPSGWIFWDETGADYYGPYPSYHESLATFKDYCNFYLGE